MTTAMVNRPVDAGARNERPQRGTPGSRIAGARPSVYAATRVAGRCGLGAGRTWILAFALIPALAGCSLLVGGSRERATIYAPAPQVQADPAWPQVAWQLSISRPEAARMVDTLRIAVRPVPGELQVYKGASWAKTPSQQVEDTVLRVLEDSGKIAGVARQGSGVAADYKLVMDLRRYEADYAGAAVPAATIEINAKLLHAPANEIVGSRTFLEAQPAAATDTGSVTQAFSQALGQVAVEIAGWTLTTGEGHQGTGPHGAAP